MKRIGTVVSRITATAGLLALCCSCGGGESLAEQTMTTQGEASEVSVGEQGVMRQPPQTKVAEFEIYGLDVIAWSGFPDGKLRLEIEGMSAPLIVRDHPVVQGELFVESLPYYSFPDLFSIAEVALWNWGIVVDGRKVWVTSTPASNGTRMLEMEIEGLSGPTKLTQRATGQIHSHGLPHHVFTSVKAAAAAHIKHFGSEAPL